MSESAYPRIEELLASTRPDDLREGLALAKQEIARVGSREARPLFEIVASMFYIDLLDRPDLFPIVDEAISLVVGFGDWVIAPLLERLDHGDLKAQLAIAHALGRIGADAVGPLVEAYRASTDASQRTFVVYAMGRIKSARVADALPLVLEAAHAGNLELRDTATRTLGKLVEWVPPQDVSPRVRKMLVTYLKDNLADPSPSIRAKAVRSLGKLAGRGFLTAGDREQLASVCLRLLGKDGNFDWDRAYVVRREAEEALRYCSATGSHEVEHAVELAEDDYTED